jgi:hypothetical protein
MIDGEIKEEIIGSSYFEFAGSKYVIVPAEEDVSVLLQGEAEGRYSLTIEDLSKENGQVLLQEIIGATSTTEMIAGFDCVDGVCGEVYVDYDANGELDIKFDWFGNYQELNQTTLVSDDKVSRTGHSSATRVGDRQELVGVVAGATTIIQEEELLRMWNILVELQQEINELKVYYN